MKKLTKEEEKWILAKIRITDIEKNINSLIIEFGVWLTGHDQETIEQMFNDWNKYRK